MNQLRCCEGCSRHVLISERECPFCQRALSPLAERVLPSVPAGLSRAQRLALAAAMASGAMTACADVEPPRCGAPVTDSATRCLPTGGTGGASAAGSGAAGNAGNGNVAVPVYGAPAPVAGTGIGVAIYGAPVAGNPSPAKDAGPPDQDADTDAGAQDAGPKRDSGQMVQPLYGAPAPVYGAPIPPPKR